MPQHTRKPVIGIIGGIASGKSAVAAEFAALGCRVIDADSIAAELLDRPEITAKIAEAFGRGVLSDSGRVDRARLAVAAFSDSGRLASLNGILHPPILAEADRLIDKYRHDRTAPAVVLDMPLLVEVGWSGRCDRLIFVKCDRGKRLKRALKKGFPDQRHLDIRENFQISLDRKESAADNIVDNNSGFSALARQVACIFTLLKDSG